MNKEKVENLLPLQSLGDCIDKITILTRKVYFGEEEAHKELSYILKSLNKLSFSADLLLASIRIGLINGEIWNLENEMRRNPTQLGNMPDDVLIEYGKRAIRIRDLNRKRIQYKNTINDLTGGYKEVKVNHASQ